MDDRQLLDAIRSIVREEITPQTEIPEKRLTAVEGDATTVKADMEVVKADMAAVKTDMEVVKIDMTAVKTEMEVVKTDMAAVKTDMEVVKTDMTAVKTEMEAVKTDMAAIKGRLTKLEVTFENHMQQIYSLLREDYSRVAVAVARTADYDDVKETVAEHQHAIENHNRRLTKLEQKAI